MPYNTRRKSLSLPSLGIQLPNTARAHRSNSKSATPDESHGQPPAKKMKREHDTPSPLSSSRNSPSADFIAPNPPRRGVEHTPPPSPSDVTRIRKVDVEGINDDIVIAVIEQLEKTGNRPHLIKELATVLASTNNSIAQYASNTRASSSAKLTLNSSANPAALLSSRLSLYMKRPWTALSPCPIAKELIPVHPRKVFFYLTCQPRGQLPANSDDIILPAVAAAKRLTPSISDPSVEDAELEYLERSRMSPSPEVDLFSPELDDGKSAPPSPGENFNGRNSIDMGQEVRHRPHRAPSPGLEADEKGFTETASAVRASRLLEAASAGDKGRSDEHVEAKQKSDHEVDYELFGRSHAGLLLPDSKAVMLSSPMMQPKPEVQMAFDDIDMDMGDAPWNMMSPENIDIDELDEMFMGF